MNGHPTIEAIALWVVDADGSDSAIGPHVSGCSQCRATSERLRELARMSAEVLDAEPPERVFDRAASLVPGPERVLRFAETIEDTSVLVGVRGDATEGRILIYRSGDYDLHVQMVPWDDGRRANLLGQLYGPGESAEPEATVSVVAGDETLAAASTNELGEFRITAALKPPFRFEVESARVRFRTPPVQGWTTP